MICTASRVLATLRNYNLVIENVRHTDHAIRAVSRTPGQRESLTRIPETRQQPIVHPYPLETDTTEAILGREHSLYYIRFRPLLLKGIPEFNGERLRRKTSPHRKLLFN